METERLQQAYEAEQIQVLEGLEAVRRRPGMYIGSTDANGLHHLVVEVVDNSIDEAMAGHADEIEVTIHTDGSLSVSDNGRGIPVDIHPKTGRPALETVLTVLHAGGKFGDGGYKVSGGLHGVGLAVVNGLSERLEVEVQRAGRRHTQEYARGLPTGDMVVGGETSQTGTRVTFKPDPEIFETVEFDAETILLRLRELAFLNKGVLLKLHDERDDRQEQFRYEGGIKSFVEHLMKNKEPLHNDIVYIERMTGDVQVEVALQYSSGYAETILSFANNINTQEGGTHVSGFRSALTRTINDYARRNNLLKENESNLSGEDVREGCIAIISVKVMDPQFEGQTKTRLGNSEVRGAVESVLGEGLSTFLEETPRAGRSIIEKALQAARAREAARKARDLTRRKNVLEDSSLPGKLADCSLTDPDQCELYIVEGDSAGGTAKQGRDRRFQAIMPLRGKILNVEKARLDRILANNEIRAMITALGTGIGDEFDLEKGRYGKVIIMSVDGDELAFVRDEDGMVRNVKIGDFIDDCYEGRLDYTRFEVLCFGLEDHATAFRPIKDVIRHPLEEKLYEIKTSCGRTVRVTSSHSVFVWENGEKRLKRGDEMKAGDYVLAPARISFAPAADSPAADTLSKLETVSFSDMPSGRAAITRSRRTSRRVGLLKEQMAAMTADSSAVTAVALGEGGYDGAAGAHHLASAQTEAAVATAASAATTLDMPRATNGRIPDLVFNLPPSRQRAYIERFRVRRDGDDERLVLRTTNKDVAGQLAYLVLGQNMGVQILDGHNAASGEKLYWVVGTRKPVAAAPAGQPSPGGDLCALPVVSVKEVQPTRGMVYDFSVETDENFIAGIGGICCHNTDADVDGAHIRTLLLTFFFRFMKPLIASGHIYIAMPPLYGVRKGRDIHYAYDDEELEEILDRIGRQGANIQRYKGLGEMNADQLWDTTMNPETRTVRRLTLDDAALADEIFTVLMGEEVEPRREFIQTHAKEVENLDV